MHCRAFFPSIPILTTCGRSIVMLFFFSFLILSVHYLHFLELSIYRVSHWHAYLKVYAVFYLLSTALYFKFYFAVV